MWHFCFTIGHLCPLVPACHPFHRCLPLPLPYTAFCSHSIAAFLCPCPTLPFVALPSLPSSTLPVPSPTHSHSIAAFLCPTRSIPYPFPTRPRSLPVPIPSPTRSLPVPVPSLPPFAFHCCPTRSIAGFLCRCPTLPFVALPKFGACYSNLFFLCP